MTRRNTRKKNNKDSTELGAELKPKETEKEENFCPFIKKKIDVPKTLQIAKKQEKE